MENEYSTRELHLAAFLITEGFQLKSHRHTGNLRDILFCFEETEKLKTRVDDYYALRTTIEPLAYVSVVRRLKSILNSYTVKAQATA